MRSRICLFRRNMGLSFVPGFCAVPIVWGREFLERREEHVTLSHLRILCLLDREQRPFLRFNLSRWVNADVFADRSPVFAPVRVPVRAMPCSLLTFAATLLPAAGILLAVGDFPVHMNSLSPQEGEDIAETKQ